MSFDVQIPTKIEKDTGYNSLDSNINKKILEHLKSMAKSGHLLTFVSDLMVKNKRSPSS